MGWSRALQGLRAAWVSLAPRVARAMEGKLVFTNLFFLGHQLVRSRRC